LGTRFETDEELKGKNPFWIDKLVPIQIATFDLDEYRNVRKEFSTDEWVDLIVRSMGYVLELSVFHKHTVHPTDRIDLLRWTRD
jgi:predicted ATP-dependent Lon-type protease